MSESRVRTSIPVDFEAGTLRGSGKIKNLSENGLFVSTNRLPDEGDTVSLCFIPPGETQVQLTGVVWWTTQSCPDRANRAAGFGLRLIDDCPPYHRAVDRLVS